MPPSENDLFDFKEKPTKKMAKTVASFANAHGGIIIIGIRDTDRRLVGVDPNPDLLTDITQYCEHISPRIRSENIDLIKQIIYSGNKKALYFISVAPSLPIDKPHFLEQKIPIRNNGCTQYVDSGQEFRKQFFPPPFDPYDYKRIEYEFDLLQNYRTEKCRLSVRFFRDISQYIKGLEKEIINRLQLEILDY